MKKETDTGIKTFDYCSGSYRYFCECNFFNPIEIKKGEACPRCKSVHTEFRETGI
jgi:hypothetical protein